jgi:hypothetical protein
MSNKPVFPGKMSTRRREVLPLVKGGILVFIGWLLSPLTWWNDSFINIPIAWLIATLAGLINQKAFIPALFITYYATNIAGIVMMYLGLSKTAQQGLLKRSIIWSIIVSILYTGLMAVLIARGIFKPASFR